ncbi:MAG: hypothetical protein LUD81_11200 [Clostridiales bacterium]|nr:hypothetical protein [Clostridiales bacterium]
MVCKTLPTFLRHKHNISLEDCDGGVYKLVKTKGIYLAEHFCGWGSYVWLKFDIVKEYEALNKKTVAGNITFKRGTINILIDNNEFCLKSHGQGYYSIKRNQNQIALIKTETIVDCGRNIYRIWYEPECKNYFAHLLLCMSMMDYMFHTDNNTIYSGGSKKRTCFTNDSLYSGITTQKHTYFRKTSAEEINWRPSDYSEAQRKEDEEYFRKTEKDEERGRLEVIIFLIVWFVFFSTIFYLSRR